MKRRDGKHIAKRLNSEPRKSLAPAHGNVIPTVCNWLDDGNIGRAVQGIRAAAEHEGVEVYGSYKRPWQIRLPVNVGPPSEDDIIIAVNELRGRIGAEPIEVKDFGCLATILKLDGVDDNLLCSVVEAMEQREVLVLDQTVWPWLLLFIKVPEVA